MCPEIVVGGGVDDRLLEITSTRTKTSKFPAKVNGRQVTVHGLTTWAQGAMAASDALLGPPSAARVGTSETQHQ
ncbi:hypothetical protein SAMN02745244_01502 [Tessaracoccus bendigoensis DSM 12906]|uniref:Uncharacterized protein n=1 Tax=Tessaracoccus bendigoensis DSM 12906 TaxID=1123357 RepID=A0A1M6FPR6_9ACTN|nr:hypothetical protein SAMN02745244_01502 [Tessaracoccus bendigoensis DSM 12906]